MGKDSGSGEHIDEERLESYCLGTSDEKESALIEEHLLWCVECTGKLEEIDRYKRAMGSAAARIREEDRQNARITARGGRLVDWLRNPLPVWGASVLITAGLIVAVGVMERPQRPGSPVEVTLEAVRGNEQGVAEAGHALTLHLDNRGLPESRQYRLEIVDDVGFRVWGGVGTWVGYSLLASVDTSLQPGTYFVRVLKKGSDPLREYKLTLQNSR